MDNSIIVIIKGLFVRTDGFTAKAGPVKQVIKVIWYQVKSITSILFAGQQQQFAIACFGWGFDPIKTKYHPDNTLPMTER